MTGLQDAHLELSAYGIDEAEVQAPADWEMRNHSGVAFS